MPAPTPGDAHTICHYCRCLSPHVYTCRTCGRDFCLQCVATETPHAPQAIACPRCGGREIEAAQGGEASSG
jgi:DNA-directed RNA polymerase subunit RPC12/RpoP